MIWFPFSFYTQPVRAGSPRVGTGSWRSRRLGLLLLVLGALSSLAWGSWLSPVSAKTTVLKVVAGENFWGSLASQLGGRLVQVTSIVTDPNADPHEYESNSADARAFAQARYVVINGAGYDQWANRLLSAQSAPGRRVLNVASLLHRREGDNPHFWYDPSDVFQVIDRITQDYRALEPQGGAYFEARHAAVEAALSPYRAHLAYLRRHFSGAKVAATESIFSYLASYLHLHLTTPLAFMKAVSEGIDPPASAVAAFEQQLSQRSFRALVYNRQTITPLTTGIRQRALAEGIPVVAVTETIEPPRATFEQWMDSQLSSLTTALAKRGRG